MGNSRKILWSLAVAMTGGLALAGEAVSAAFTFDARYPASGMTPADWTAHEAVGCSGRFTAETVVRALDLNGNGIPDEWDARYGLTGTAAAAGADPDEDGRTNLEEYNAGTNPVLAERYDAGVALSACWTADTWLESTAGGLWMLVEVVARSGMFTTDTAGRAPDADKDGLPDWWERQWGTNPIVPDAHLDADGDGRTNLEEYNAGTNPWVKEQWERSSDESPDAFVTDTRVWYTGGNPALDTTFAVVKVSNGFICDTGGLYYDWDGDGIPNWWEARFSRDGSKTGLSATADEDADGASNYREFIAYTDPRDAASRFRISLEPVVGGREVASGQAFRLASVTPPQTVGRFKLTWLSAKGRTYHVYASDDLAKGWPAEPIATLSGTGEEIGYEPPVGPSVQFFKVTVRLADDY